MVRLGYKINYFILFLKYQLEADTMHRLKLNALHITKVLPDLRHKHIHAPAQEIIFFTPDIQQDIFPFNYSIGMQAKVLQQVSLFLGKLLLVGAIYQ